MSRFRVPNTNTRPVPSSQNKHKAGVKRSYRPEQGKQPREHKSTKGPGKQGNLEPQPPGLGDTWALEMRSHCHERKLKLSKKAALWKPSIPTRKWVSEEPVQDASQQMGV